MEKTKDKDQVLTLKNHIVYYNGHHFFIKEKGGRAKRQIIKSIDLMLKINDEKVELEVTLGKIIKNGK